MTVLIKYCFLLIFTLSISISPQTIDVVEITGSSEFSKSELTGWSGLRKGIKYFAGLTDSAKHRIASNLSDRGYHHFTFSETEIIYSSDSSKVNINFNVDIDNPTYVNDIIFENDSTISDEIINSFGFIKGQIFDKSNIEKTIEKTLVQFENQGYPFSKIVINSAHIYKDSLSEEYLCDLHLTIDAGLESTISNVEIRGNSSTKEYVIIRELRIDKGEKYSQERIEELPRRLNRLRFFQPVSIPQFFINSKKEGILLVEVKEKETNNFDGILGYIPGRDESEKGYLTGLVNISLRNLFGTGRALAFRWQQIDRNSQDLELKYLEPWFLNYPLNINIALFQRKQDSSYVQRRLEGGIEYLATEDISAGVFISSQSVIPTEREIPIFTVFNSSIFTSGINARIDSRDDPYAPTSGLLFDNSYSFSQKTINGPAAFITENVKTKINHQRITFDFSIFYELFLRQVIAVSVHGRELRGDTFENSDLFRLGGTNSLRGYREDQFLGSRVLWTNLEYRYLLSPRSFASLFFDTGYYLRKAEPERLILNSEEFKYGYGLGINLETALGVLGVSFALGEGDSFGDGKIHFGIINEF